jgi:S-adenosylmethionine:diacylglycerol 3-amino-3-carboxypropyl transferase
MTATPAETAWERGRLDMRSGPRKLLFGRMYEDASIELSFFRPGGRIFSIASAGCTAMKLASRHEVLAVDINPVQLAYARRRFEGVRGERGVAERVMAFGRFLAPLAGWGASRLSAFLDLEDTEEQTAFWRRHLDTRRFRMVSDTFLCNSVLRAVYAPAFLHSLPCRFGRVLRGRMERCFARHPNRANPYARALLLGELPDNPPRPDVRKICLVHSDAVDYLEDAPAAGFDGFTLSNILDGASQAYRRRLFSAVRRAAAPGAVVVLRSFGEPLVRQATNYAADDRAMLWGVVDVRPAIEL